MTEAQDKPWLMEGRWNISVLGQRSAASHGKRVEQAEMSAYTNHHTLYHTDYLSRWIRLHNG